MIECPHCFTKVIAKADSTCPACGRIVLDKDGTSPGQTAVILTPGQELPSLCTSCGTFTERRVRISRSIPVGSEELQLSSPGLLSAFFAWALRLSRRSVAVDIPLCALCGSSRIRLLHVDFENYAMTLVVDKAFRDALNVTAASLASRSSRT